jgi:hypothetical protein
VRRAETRICSWSPGKSGAGPLVSARLIVFSILLLKLPVCMPTLSSSPVPTGVPLINTSAFKSSVSPVSLLLAQIFAGESAVNILGAGVGVLVGVGAIVEMFVGVRVGVFVGVLVGVLVGVGVGVFAGVFVRVLVGVLVGVFVGVGVGVLVDAFVGVGVGVGVGVLGGVLVGVGVFVEGIV